MYHRIRVHGDLYMRSTCSGSMALANQQQPTVAQVPYRRSPRMRPHWESGEPFMYHPSAVDVPPRYHTCCELTPDRAACVGDFFLSDPSSEVKRSSVYPLQGASSMVSSRSDVPASEERTGCCDPLDTAYHCTWATLKLELAELTVLWLGGICKDTGW